MYQKKNKSMCTSVKNIQQSIYLYWQSIAVLLLYLILQIILYMVFCANMHITNSSIALGYLLDFNKKTRQFAFILLFDEFSS